MTGKDECCSMQTGQRDGETAAAVPAGVERKGGDLNMD